MGREGEEVLRRGREGGESSRNEGGSGEGYDLILPFSSEGAGYATTAAKKADADRRQKECKNL